MWSRQEKNLEPNLVNSISHLKAFSCLFIFLTCPCLSIFSRRFEPALATPMEQRQAFSQQWAAVKIAVARNMFLSRCRTIAFQSLQLGSDKVIRQSTVCKMLNIQHFRSILKNPRFPTKTLEKHPRKNLISGIAAKQIANCRNVH